MDEWMNGRMNERTYEQTFIFQQQSFYNFTMAINIQSEKEEIY